MALFLLFPLSTESTAKKMAQTRRDLKAKKISVRRSSNSMADRTGYSRNTSAHRGAQRSRILPWLSAFLAGYRILSRHEGTTDVFRILRRRFLFFRAGFGKPLKQSVRTIEPVSRRREASRLCPNVLRPAEPVEPATGRPGRFSQVRRARFKMCRAGARGPRLPSDRSAGLDPAGQGELEQIPEPSHLSIGQTGSIGAMEPWSRGASPGYHRVFHRVFVARTSLATRSGGVTQIFDKAIVIRIDPSSAMSDRRTGLNASCEVQLPALKTVGRT